ncbi:MAG: DoxX family membrane protein [Paludibacteraceae bacterium]|nr:DoxX family membrane protein [Paludibacteraceae bacterium]
MINCKRIPAILVGLAFVLSGLGKIGNIIGFQHLIFDYGLSIFHLLAPFIVLAEILLGILLIFNVQIRAASVVGICMLVIFTCAFLYGWLENDITDCGCFGYYLPIPSSPTLTFIRNVLLILLLIWTYYHATEYTQTIEQWEKTTIYTIMFSATFVAGMSYKPFAFTKHRHPYENQLITDTPLGSYTTAEQGDSELIFFFSYSCPHCINSMENFKAWGATNAVDNPVAYVVVDSTNTHIDSLRNLFRFRYPSIQVRELNIDSTKFIDAYPSAFLIKNDTIQYVIIGELPSPYLFEW